MTLREAVWAARARQDAAWAHTSALIASVIGLFSKDPIHPDDFHPLRQAGRGQSLKDL